MDYEEFSTDPEELRSNNKVEKILFKNAIDFDVFYNKNQIPLIVFIDLIETRINFMNLTSQKIENYIQLSTDYELDGSSITYYKSNKNEEFLLNIIKEEGIIDIYELNNYQIILSNNIFIRRRDKWWFKKRIFFYF